MNRYRKSSLPLAEVIESQRQANGVEVLPIRLEHVLTDVLRRALDPAQRLSDVAAGRGRLVFGRTWLNSKR